MTFRPYPLFCLLCVAGLLVPGCTNLIARRAIINFAESLEEGNLDQIRVASSETFESRALRQPEAISDLKLMKFPKGDVKVVSIEEIDKTTKLAKVEIGKKDKTKLVDYRLTLDRETGRWVVDDVILSQDDTTGQEIRRSVTDQMDLLLSCREVLKDWESAPRTVKLQHCTNDLHAALSTLPPNWFNQVTEQAVGKERSVTFRPEARLNGDRAVVVAPHADGNLFVEFQKEQNHWKVQNIVIEPRAGGSADVHSVLSLAHTLNHAAQFLTSFVEQDHEQLQKFTTPDFYSQSLANGDLGIVRLPVASLIADDYRAKQYKDRTELLLEATGATYMLTVRMVDTSASEGNPGPQESRVDEVTIFDAEGTEVKKVSAMLLSSSVVDLFVEALRTRNLQQIRTMSSNDFNERVWKTEASRHFGIMPYPHLEPGEPEVLSTIFRGDITEVTVAVGNTPMTFVLRLGEGWMVVDDVQIPSHDRPVSLKTNLEILLPIHAFASAVNRGDVSSVANYSTNSMETLVWRQLNYVPEISRQLVRPMLSEVIRIAPSESWMVVQTTDGRFSSEIKLERKGERFVVHDITLINEASPTNRFEYMKSVRQMIASGQLLPKGAYQETVLPVSGTVEAPEEATNVQQVRSAGFEPISPEIYRH